MAKIGYEGARPTISTSVHLQRGLPSAQTRLGQLAFSAGKAASVLAGQEWMDGTCVVTLGGDIR
jgi:hypothetical protein